VVLASRAVAGRLIRVVQVGAGHTLDSQETGSALLNAEDAVVDQGKIAGNGGIELDHAGSTGRDQGGLKAAGRRGDEVTLPPDLIKDGANDVEGRNQVGSSVTKEKPNSIAGLRLESLVSLKRANLTVEDDKRRVLVHALLLVKVKDTRLGVSRGIGGVQLVLDHIVLLIDRRETLLGLNQDQAEHAVRLMDSDGADGAMVDVEARDEQLELSALALIRVSSEETSSTARSSDGVEVNIVKHAGHILVGEVHVEEIAFPGADHGSGDASVEGPELVGVNIVHGKNGNLSGHVDGEADRVVPLDRRGAVRRPTELSLLHYELGVLFGVVTNLAQLVRRGGREPREPSSSENRATSSKDGPPLEAFTNRHSGEGSPGGGEDV